MKIAVFSAKRYDREFLDAANVAAGHDLQYFETRFFLVPGTGTVYVDSKLSVIRQRSVAEGFYTAVAARDLARKKKIDMPITEQVYQVLHRRRPLLEALKTLLEREYSEELRGIRE